MPSGPKDHRGNIHAIIPDTQAKKGVPTAHLKWVGQYIVDELGGIPNVKIIHLGDHWDMPSLSSYDRGTGKMEGRRYADDIKYGNEAWEILQAPILAAMGKTWQPELHFLHGNHEERIVRAANQDAQLDGILTLDDLAVNRPESKWLAHPFLKPVSIDGVVYAHYFTARGTGKPLGGQSIDARIKTVGHSFVQGHTQGLWFGRREVIGGAHVGIVAGSAYLHQEEYLGHQGNDHWRGMGILYDVRRGDFDPKFVSLGSLCRKYTGKSLGQFLGRH